MIFLKITEQVLPTVDRADLERREDEVFDERLAQILSVKRGGAGAEGFLLEALQPPGLADITGHAVRAMYLYSGVFWFVSLP